MTEHYIAMIDWYRKLALSLLTILIVSAIGQWTVWVRWSAKIDEQHVAFREDIGDLQKRPIAAANAGPRIAVMESRLTAILNSINRVDNKIDKAIARQRINMNQSEKPWTK